MNQRILELMRRSGAYDYYEINEGVEGDEKPMKKFAELIVDECCLKLLNMDEKTKGSHNYYKHAAVEIKKHFGVKE